MSLNNQQMSLMEAISNLEIEVEQQRKSLNAC